MRAISVILVLVWMLAIGLLLGMAHLPEKVAPIFASMNLDAGRSTPYLLGTTLVIPLLLLWAVLHLQHNTKVVQKQLALYGLSVAKLEDDLATLEAMDEVAQNDVGGDELGDLTQQIAGLKQRSQQRDGHIAQAEQEWPVRLERLQQQIVVLREALESQRTKAATLKSHAASVTLAVRTLQEAAEDLGFAETAQDVTEAETRAKELTGHLQALTQLPARLEALQAELESLQPQIDKLSKGDALSTSFKNVHHALTMANQVLDEQRLTIRELVSDRRGFRNDMRLSDIMEWLGRDKESLAKRIEDFQQIKEHIDALVLTFASLQSSLAACKDVASAAEKLNDNLGSAADDLDTAEEELRNVVSDDDDYDDDMSPDDVLTILNRDADDVRNRAEYLQNVNARIAQLSKTFAGNGEAAKTT
jgi:chromosome segregation ATPase